MFMHHFLRCSSALLSLLDFDAEKLRGEWKLKSRQKDGGMGKDHAVEKSERLNE